ncbi:hypothetical protein EsH8_I_000539 [Colletotrichum jinshuiense]
MAHFRTRRGNQELLDSRLAFLALTFIVDEWNHEYPHVTSDLLSDSDQQLLTRFYTIHLMPTAHSFWWNSDNANRAKTELVNAKYPLVKSSTWKRSRPKATDILKIWRKDAARLFPELVEDGLVDCQSSKNGEALKKMEVAAVAATGRDRKRRGDDTVNQSTTPKRTTMTSVYDGLQHSDDGVSHSRSNSNPKTPISKGVASAVLTPPESNESGSTTLNDSDSEDQEPVPMRRRRNIRGRLTVREGTPEHVPADPTPSDTTPVWTVASIKPVEQPHQYHTCMVTLQEVVESMAISHDRFVSRERAGTEYQFKKWAKKGKRLSKKIERLTKSTKRLVKLVKRLKSGI